MLTPEICPQCSSQNIYHDGSLWNCPDCGKEWVESETKSEEAQDKRIRDAFGNVLQNGDSVTVVKDLKIKGASSSVKVGTKVKNIKLLEDAEDGHNISCRIEGIGSLNLKSEFVKKA